MPVSITMNLSASTIERTRTDFIAAMRDEIAVNYCRVERLPGRSRLLLTRSGTV